MPSTAKLLSAEGNTAVHAYKPEDDQTLCGLDVVDPADYDDVPPPRSADLTGRRYYFGVHRRMCETCWGRATKIRIEMVGSGQVGFPLSEVVGR